MLNQRVKLLGTVINLLLETVINDKFDLQLNLFLEFKNMTKKVKNIQKKNDLKSKVQKLHETYISSTQLVNSILPFTKKMHTDKIKILTVDTVGNRW